jgi:hypothetical protein
MTHGQVAKYIMLWLRTRNASRLNPAIMAMSVEDYELMQEELAHILKHNGHPPNWAELREPKPGEPVVSDFTMAPPPPDDTTITLPDGRVLSNAEALQRQVDNLNGTIKGLHDALATARKRARVRVASMRARLEALGIRDGMRATRKAAPKTRKPPRATRKKRGIGSGAR